MKVFLRTKYGSTDVLFIKDIEKSSPKENKVLVKVCAASVNVDDLEHLRGTFAVRMSGPLKPKYKILGSDIAGRIEAVGNNVKQFKLGDEVFGDLTEYGFGGFAEYVCVSEDALVLKPANLSFEEASTLTSRASIAVRYLRAKRQIQPGDKVLVNGAGGGVGTFAVQIAKYFGAEVTGVDSTAKLDMLRYIGADNVIDYTREDFTKNEQHYDLILDVSAHHSILEYKSALSENGIYLIVGGSRSSILQALLLGPFISMIGNKKMGIPFVGSKKEDLIFIKDLVEAGKVVPVIDRYFPFEEIPEALRYLEQGKQKGKIIINFK
ncbi:MAG: NAD(P)-dependent alcohol dehydrogenase [Candidatus Bathyarchaeota archaeon]